MQIGRYIYCIIPCAEKINFGRIGIEDSEVYTIPYKDISTVISSINLKSIEPNETNILKHEGVIRFILDKYTTLPLKFGTVLRNEYDVKYLLMKLYMRFKVELMKLENKVEFGIKIFLSEEQIKYEINRMNAEIKKLKEGLPRRIETKSLGEAMMRQLDNIETDEGKSPDEYAVKLYYAEKFFEMLKRCAKDACANKLISKDMVLNGAFLISKDKIGEFQREIEKIKTEYESRGFEFLSSGPWAPYNFVNIRYE